MKIYKKYIIVGSIVVVVGLIGFYFYNKNKNTTPVAGGGVKSGLTQSEADAIAKEIYALTRGVKATTADDEKKIKSLTVQLSSAGYVYVYVNGKAEAKLIESKK